MEMQPQLVLLQKTLLNIEGLGRQLYPELDLWQTGQPVLREWMAERTGPKAMVRRLREELPEIRYMLDQLPTVMRRVLDRSWTRSHPPPPRPERQHPYKAGRNADIWRFPGLSACWQVYCWWASRPNPAWLGWGLGGPGRHFALVLGRPRLK